MRAFTVGLCLFVVSACGTPGTGVNYTSKSGTAIEPNSTVSLNIIPPQADSDETQEMVKLALRAPLRDRLATRTFAQVVGPDEQADYRMDVVVTDVVFQREMAQASSGSSGSLLGDVLLLGLGGKAGANATPDDFRWLYSEVALESASTGSNVLSFDAKANGNVTEETVKTLVDYIGTGIECHNDAC